MHAIFANMLKVFGIAIGGLLGLILVFGYFELHPGDDFYLKEFEKVTLRTPPISSRVAARSASLFALHNESCSYSRIEMSQQDYLHLFECIDADHRFVHGTTRLETVVDGKVFIHEQSKILETDNQHEVWNRAKYIPERASYVRLVPKDSSRHYSLMFLSDGKHIEVNSCRT
jgi:hypothetical protein